ncbi:MAG TPA: MBL fold metallo-hydrolase [Polyangia bacterium]|jgi:glyoxylase-like metal-dependent hydrolase (beta-lactamase superfamily II)
MRAIKGLFILAVIVAILGGGATIGLRVARGKPSGVEEVKPGIVAVSSVSSYVYAAKVGSKVILFDAGADPAGSPIDAALGWLHAGRSDINDLFLSHGHGDHSAGAASLGHIRIRLGAGDLALAEKKVPPEALAGKAFTLAMGFPAVTPSDPLTGPATFDVGDAQDAKDPKNAKKVKAFPIPGHTPGSYAYLYDGVLFVGDAMIFKQGRLDPAIKLFDAHPDENKASIRALQKQIENEEIDIICTGHGGCTPKGMGRNQLTDLIARL